MTAFTRRAPLAAVGIALAGGLLGCGNNVTGPVTWHASVVISADVVRQGNNAEMRYQKLTGQLVDSHQRVISGTQFRESCKQLYFGGKPTGSLSCLALVNTGPHIYVAGGHTDALTGELPVLADPKTGGAFFISVVGPSTITTGQTPFTVRIVVQPGGGSPVS